MEELLFRQRIDTEMDIHLAIHKAGSALSWVNDADGILTAKIKTTLSELGYNILKYAKTGSLTLYRQDSPRKAVRVFAYDQGPGIPDIALALKDHYSSGGTLGLGLPGVKRLMDRLDIESKPGQGTQVSALLYV